MTSQNPNTFCSKTTTTTKRSR